MTEDGTTGGEQRPGSATTPAQRARPGVGRTGTGGTPRALLTAQDVRRLTLFKWRYSLESVGFTPRQAAHLLFLKWLHARRGAPGGPAG